MSWCHGVIVYCTQAYGRLYRTGDRGKWTAGQLEAGFFLFFFECILPWSCPTHFLFTFFRRFKIFMQVTGRVDRQVGSPVSLWLVTSTVIFAWMADITVFSGNNILFLVFLKSFLGSRLTRPWATPEPHIGPHIGWTLHSILMVGSNA